MFFSEPSLWRSLDLTAESLRAAADGGQAVQWFASKACLLQRVGRFVQHLKYSRRMKIDVEEEEAEEEEEPMMEIVDMQLLAVFNGVGWQLSSSVLAQLSPAALQSLTLEGADADDTAASLRRFNRLTALTINRRGPVPDCVAAALPSLPQLQALQLNGGAMPAGLLAAVRHLPQLSSLHCNSGEPLWELSSLFPFTQLRRLCWSEQRPAGIRRLDVQQLLAHLPHLEWWNLYAALPGLEGCLQVRPFGVLGMSIRCTNLEPPAPDVIRDSGITQSMACAFACNAPQLQVGDAILECCRVSGCERASGTARSMMLSHIEFMSSLQQLMAASLPAGALPGCLGCLRISYSSLSPAAVQACAFLGRLTALDLSFCKFEDGDAAPVVAALLQQAPRLHSLTFVECFQQQPLPPALFGYTGLRHLSLRWNALRHLPPGHTFPVSVPHLQFLAGTAHS